jgi:hypothetical protein
VYFHLRKIYSRLRQSPQKISAPKGNFVRIFFGSEYVKPNMKECDWAFSTYPEEQIKNPRYMRMPNRVSDDKIKNWGVPQLKKKINFEKIKKEKTKFCNFIYSQEIPERNSFFKKLNKYKRVDSPGRCMNNMPPIGHGSPKKSRESANWAKEKLDFLKSYKFTIGFENFSAPGWVTEKLTHPMLVNSIPIYFGHKEVAKDFNTRSFINANDFKNIKELIKYVIKVDNDDKLYEKILNEPWFKDNKFSKDFDNERLLKRFKEIFG